MDCAVRACIDEESFVTPLFRLLIISQLAGVYRVGFRLLVQL